MRQVKRWRYYCDHCRKAGGSKGHMVAHENGCTANPNRKCRICALAPFDPMPLSGLIGLCQKVATCNGGPDPEGPGYYTIDAAGLAQLREAADGCPVCMFAAMRQAKVWPAYPLEFKLKEELAPVWSGINDKHAARDRGY
jgi:hypothetical protein